MMVLVTGASAGSAPALRTADPGYVWFMGRLATYRYYDMDQIVGQALAILNRIDASLPPRAANDDAPPVAHRLASRS